MKIMWVEDDTFIDSALVKMLAANHHTLDRAADGKTGLNQALAVAYDLIVLDLQIPPLDGIDLCRQLRSHGYRKPILLLTEKDSNADIVAGLDAGADDYVIKPYTPEALLKKIRIWLRRSGASASERLANPASNSRMTATETNNGQRYKPSAEDIATTKRVMERLGNSFKKQIATRIAVLEQAKTALLAGSLDRELLRAAQHEAHKLAGSMGTFGYPDGSKLALAIEHLLRHDRTLTPEEVSRFSQLVAALQQELTKSVQDLPRDTTYGRGV